MEFLILFTRRFVIVIYRRLNEIIDTNDDATGVHPKDTGLFSKSEIKLDVFGDRAFSAYKNGLNL